MKKSKTASYLGLCAKAGRLRTGTNTCLPLLASGKVRLLIVAEDCSSNTIEKMSAKARGSGTAVRVYGRMDELSHATGRSGSGVYAVTDEGFANVIIREIDRERSEGEQNGEKNI